MQEINRQLYDIESAVSHHLPRARRPCPSLFPPYSIAHGARPLRLRRSCRDRYARAPAPAT